MINKRVNSFFVKFWERSKDFSQFSFLDKFLFFILICFEKLYILGFYIFLFFVKNFKKPYRPKFRVLSVGNISVGGTGKSVFVEFLAKNLMNKSGAIVLRGYKGEAEQTGKSFIVSDGYEIFQESSFVGDEPVMLSKSLKIPVVVGSNKIRSCLLLENNFKNLDYVILDDAYQNFKIKKDFEVLLLDAQFPFENGHCLPAGRLREKNFSRADAIIISHADSISLHKLEDLKNKLSLTFDKKNIFYGIHSFSGIYLNDDTWVDFDDIIDKKVLVLAGIGSFNSFEKSVKNLGFKNIILKEYPDHYNYNQNDVNEILNYLNLKLVDMVLTTQKDWVKILSLLKHEHNLPIFVLRVEFSFLDRKQKDVFLDKIERKLN